MSRRTASLASTVVLSLCLHLAVFGFVPTPQRGTAQGFGSGGIAVSLGPAGREPGGEVSADGPIEDPEAPAEELAEPEPEAPVEEAAEPEPEAPAEELPEPEPEALVEEVTEPEPEALAEELPEPEPETLAEEVTEPEAPAETAEAVNHEAVLPEPPEEGPLQQAHVPAPPADSVEQRPRPPVPPRRPARVVAKEDDKPQARPPQSAKRTAGQAGRSGTAGTKESGSGDETQGGGRPGAEADYYALLQTWLEKHKRYPRRAKLRNQQGVVLLRFVVARDGKVTDFSIEQSSAHKLLDDEVRKMIERSQPMPKIPPDMNKASLELVVPVRFMLR